MEITDHAFKRAKERLGLSKKALLRHMEKVESHGLGHGRFTGSMKRYLDKEFLAYNKASKMKIYGHFLYIISGDNALITILDVPSKYFRYIDQAMKEHDDIDRPDSSAGGAKSSPIAL